MPEEIVDGLRSGRRPPVHVTINGCYTYRSTVARRGGAFMLPISAEVRDRASVAAGDEIDVDLELELDTEPRYRGDCVPATRQRRIESTLAAIRHEAEHRKVEQAERQIESEPQQPAGGQ